MSLEATLDLIKNASLYEQRLKELKEAEAKAKAEVAKVTKARDLDQAISRAKEAERIAKSAQAAAEKKANEIIQHAEEKAKEIIDQSNGQVASINQRISEKENDLAALNTNATLMTQQLESFRDELSKLSEAVKGLQAEKQELTASIQDKTRKLRELLSQG